MGERAVAEPMASSSPALPAGVSPTEKRQFVRRLFSTIAPRYDWFNRLASGGLARRWRIRTITEAKLEPGMRVLDVCTGTGDLVFLAAPKVGSTGHVVGLDFTWPMLARAVSKTSRDERHIAWLQGDAQQLPFRHATFDRVLIGFSTRNLSDLRQGLTDMLRIVKDEGQLLVLETGRPAHPVLRVGYWIFLRTVARFVGWALTGRAWPFTYLARSAQGFLTPAQMIALLTSCGATARYVPLSGGLASLYVVRKCPA